MLSEVRASVLCDRVRVRVHAREVCGLACAEQRRVLIPHGVKRHHLGIGGVDGRSLRRVVVWRAASPITPRATAMLLETCEIGVTGPHYFDKICGLDSSCVINSQPQFVLRFCVLGGQGFFRVD